MGLSGNERKELDHFHGPGRKLRLDIGQLVIVVTSFSTVGIKY